MSWGRGAARGRGIAVALACTLLLATTIGAAGATNELGRLSDAAASFGGESAAPAEPTLSVDVDRNGSTLVYRATVDGAADVDRLRLDGAFGIYDVTGTDGFVADDGGYRLLDGRDSATLTARIDLSRPRTTPLGTVGPNGPFQAGEGWAFAPSPRFSVRWTGGGADGIRRVRFADESVAVDAPTDVAVGERFVFLGPHRVESREVDGREVRVVVPRGVDYRVGVERSFDLFAGVRNATASAEARPAETGSTEPGPVTTFVLPGSVRSGGATSGTDVWVRADAGEVTVAHEYAHALLTLPTTQRTGWLREAAAEYVGYRVAGPDDVRATLRDRVRHPDASLANPAAWPDGWVPYRKGAAVLAALDARIRAATGGEASLMTLLDRLSAQRAGHGPLTREAFLSAVRSTAGEETAEWYAANERSFEVGAEDRALLAAPEPSATRLA